MIRYFEWGNEPTGKVTVWITSKQGEVIILGTIKKELLPDNAIFDCPYN